MNQDTENKKAESKKRMKALGKILWKYYIASVIVAFVMIFAHYPPEFYEGNTFKFVYELIHDGWYLHLFWFFFLQFAYALLIMPFFIFSKVKYVGWIPLAIWAFLIGLEKYIFYIQGQATPWNVGFNESMLINFLANPTGLTDTIQSYGRNPMFWFYNIVVPIIYFVFFMFVSKKLPKIDIPEKKWLEIGALVMIIVGPSFTYDRVYTPYYFGVQRTAIDHLHIKFIERFGGKRMKPYFEYHKDKNVSTPQNIIMIRDESVRGDLLSINNQSDPMVMKTTPYLYANRDKFVNLGNLWSGYNCSFPSNSLFLIGYRFDDLEKIPLYRIKAPTIYQYMKQAGYTTHYVDNLHNGLYFMFHNDDRQYLDHVHNSFKKWMTYPKYIRDIKTLDEVKKILHNGKKNFIVILKYGIHFPYNNAIKPGDEPLGHVDPYSTKHMDYYKLYLNALKQSVDNYWKHLIEDTVKGTDTVVLWDSDHSVNIVPDKHSKYISITHCEMGMTYYREMYSVPGIIYSPNKKWLEGFKKHYKNGYAVTPIFSTLLQFAGYSPKDYEKYYGPSFKNPPLKARIMNNNKVYVMDVTGKNTSIYNDADLEEMKLIDPLNKRRDLPNTIPNRYLDTTPPRNSK